MSSRAAAIAAAGMVLSQPTSSTIASRQWPRTASSIESAIVSRETSEARMPSLPIAMPSVTAIVLNSIGVPPPATMPRRACCARSRRVRLHGETSDHACTTATSGFAIAPSSSPVARSIARAGAREGPCLIASLLMFRGFLERKPRAAKTKTPRLFGRGVLVLSTWVWWCYLRKPDSRAGGHGNKDEYEDEHRSEAAIAHERHVGGRVVEELRLAVALRHGPSKPRLRETCQHIFSHMATESRGEIA